MKMNLKTIFGLAAAVGLLAVTAPVDRAQAVSLINPGVSTSGKQVSEPVATQVHWRRHHRRWHRHHGWHRHRGWHRHPGWRHHRHWHRRHHWF